jgi:hypothetical protein
VIRVVVCGGRRYADDRYVSCVLDELHRSRGIDVIVHGDATGADALADEWAQLRGVQRVKYPASWASGRGAGPRRNARMLDEVRPDIVVAFPGGAGTADCIRQAKQRGIDVLEPT